MLGHFRSERDAFGDTLMKALRDNLPWGLEVDLGNGQKAILQPMNGVPDASQPSRQPIYPEGTPITYDPSIEPIGWGEWRIIFDWKLVNCDQDHIEITAQISGGGGGA